MAFSNELLECAEKCRLRALDRVTARYGLAYIFCNSVVPFFKQFLIFIRRDKLWSNKSSLLRSTITSITPTVS